MLQGRTIEMGSNKINIGNDNKINKSVIGNNMSSNDSSTKQKWYGKLIWKIIVPIIIAVVAAAICMLLKLK